MDDTPQLTINIIGAGNVGQTLGYLFVKNRLAQIGGIYNQSRQSTLDAIRFIGQGYYCSSMTDLPHADLTLITAPDDYIAQLGLSLSLNQSIQVGDVVVHCSGALTSNCLFSLKEKGCFVASIHPMRSFKRPEISVHEYAGTYCATEGDSQALAIIEPLFESIDSIVHRIKEEKKPLYHAAAVFASNYLITMSHEALSCLTEAGVKNEVAIQLIVDLMQSTVTNLARIKSPKEALTGPVQRGDIATIERHLSAFTNQRQRDLYNILAQATSLLKK